jgi:hypothetical protein
LSVESYLKGEWCREQIGAEVPISHEAIYLHIYADKALGGVLYRHLRCKKRRKRYAGGRDRRGQIIGRTPISNAQTILKGVARLGIGRAQFY